MSENYMNYDSARGTIAEDLTNVYKIDAYEDSTSSIVIKPKGTFNSIERTMLKMKRMGPVNSFMIIIPISAAIILLHTLLFIYVVGIAYTIDKVAGVAILVLSFIIILNNTYVILNALDIPYKIIHLEGVGDHLTDDDIEKIIDLYLYCRGDSFDFIEDVRNLIAEKDPAGVKPEISDQYNESMKNELEELEMKKQEIVHKLSNLDVSLSTGSNKID